MERLPLSSLLFESIVQSTNDAIAITDAGLGIMEWNRSAERIFGYAAEEIIGSPLDCLAPERYRDSQRSEIERFKLTGRSNLIGHTIITQGQRKDGTEFPLELSFASWSSGDGTFFTAVMRDMTNLDAIIELSRLLLQNKEGRLGRIDIDYVRRILARASRERLRLGQVESARPAA